MFDYQLEIHEEAAGVWLSCPAVPEMHAAGETLEEALASAPDALETALSFYVDGGKPVPLPGKLQRGRYAVVRLPALTAAKASLWNAMLADGISKAELARRLGRDRPHVDRLLDFLHSTRMDGIEAALQAVGRRLAVVVEAA